MNVLIAEDDVTTRTMVNGVLTRAGYDVTAVENGDDAWERLRDRGPVLAVLDWMMPGLDGTEVVRRVREQEKGGSASDYLILLTSRNSKADIVEGLEFGADDYVVKPFDGNELLARIRVGERVMELQRALAARVSELQNALDRIRTLHGLIPICAGCKKIRDDQGYWQQVEKYITDRSDAEFSHGLCPECMRDIYPPEICEGLEKERAARADGQPADADG